MALPGRVYQALFAMGLLVLATSWVGGAWFALRASGRLPGDLDPLSMARSHSLAGRSAEALREYRVVSSIDPANVTASEEMVDLLSRTESSGVAIRAAQQALALRPTDSRRLVSLALALAGASRFEEATTHLDLALRLAPGYAPTHVGIGDYWWIRGDLARAAGAYERALTLDPRNVGAHNKLGVAMASLGDPGGAVGHFETALRLQPDSTSIAANLARARTDAGGSR